MLKYVARVRSDQKPHVAHYAKSRSPGVLSTVTVPLFDITGSTRSHFMKVNLSRGAMPSPEPPEQSRIDGETQLSLEASSSDPRDRDGVLYVSYAMELLQLLASCSAKCLLNQDPLHDPMIWRWILGSLKRPVDS